MTASPMKLLDETIVSENDLGNLPEDLSHDLFDLFRIELLCHGRVAGHIREQDRHILPGTVSWGEGLLAFPWGGLLVWR